MRYVDVVILGGGPAGCSTALSLRTHAPTLSVVLVEASSYDQPRVGEVLPAAARALLNQLGVLKQFEHEPHRPVHTASAAWGSSHCRGSHAIYSARGAGWHLDRARFDAFLASQVALRGAEIRLNARPEAVEHLGDSWRLRLTDGAELGARFVVDATGRRAAFALKAGARRLAFDRLVSFSRYFTLADHPEPGTLIEAFPEGWWYTALAGDRRVVTCLTDADIARRLALRDQERWLDLMFESHWIRRSVAEGEICGPLITRAANSGHLEPMYATDWLAVGDTASSYDPLSSQGITKALRSGILASFAIADSLVKSETTGLARYEQLVRREFAGYRRARARYYDEECRWPSSDFWRRRRKVDSNRDGHEQSAQRN